MFTINFPDAIILGRVYDGDGAFPAGLQGQLICSSGQHD